MSLDARPPGFGGEPAASLVSESVVGSAPRKCEMSSKCTKSMF